MNNSVTKVIYMIFDLKQSDNIKINKQIYHNIKMYNRLLKFKV